MHTYKFTLPSTLLKQVGIAALYASLLYLGDLFFESDAIIGHFESASGLALAALLIGGKQYAWSIFFGAALTNTIQGDSLLEMAIVASGDTLQALCGYWLLNRKGNFDLRIQSLHDYFRLIMLGGFASVLTCALAIHIALLVFGLLPTEGYFESLLHWFLADTLGIVLVVPLVLVWWQARIDWRETKKIFEACLLLGLVILVGQIIFFDWLPNIIGHTAQSYWMFLLITWVAIVLGARGTTIALFIVANQALLGAMAGSGFFANDIATSSLISFWFYMLTQ